jgi:fumarylpyruvate hydrolase
MTDYVFSPAQAPYVEVAGTERRRFPVHRIYCVGRNYADHVREMGGTPERSPPIFFTKPADAIVHDGADVPYPPRTRNLHHEVELVVAIGKGGSHIAPDQALAHVFGYAVGNDYTRRDLQKQMREAGQPWDVAKAFDHSAAISAIHPVETFGHLSRGRIWLTVNGEQRQEADLAEMIWDVPGVIAELSTFWTLQPGDLIYTGTPAGVGPVVPGDSVVAGIDGLDTLRNTIFAAR